MNKLLTILFLFILSVTNGQAPAGYYDSAQGLTGYQLKTALKSIITNGHNAHSYNDLYNAYETTDTDHYYENDGTVLDMYSENPTGPDPYNYQHHQRTCGSYTGEGICYNREHLIPQSIFNSASPMVSDAHFVVPSDGYVNNRRSNNPFGVVNNPTWTSLNGSKLGPNTVYGYTGTVFEPIDEFKGDIARMLFYVATRYEDQISSWNSSDMLDGSSDQVFTDWFLHVLLDWAAQDPVSQREIDRNNAVYAYQGNRNPFIDHPEWVNAIWNPNPDTTAPSVPTGLSVTSVSDTSFEVSWQASTDNVMIAGYEVYLDGNLVATVTDTQYAFSGLTPATTYNVCIKAKDTSGNLSACSTSLSVTTANAVNYILQETFDDCNNMVFDIVNEASDKDWHCIAQYGENNSPAIQMNGYQEDVASKDWLITHNKINFDSYSNEKLSVFLAYAYGTTPLELVYSADYDGNGSPQNFTWTAVPNINIPVPNDSSTPTEVTFTDIDISSISGQVYLAFKYYSNGNPTRWTVDSVRITGDNAGVVNQYVQTHTKIFPNPLYHGEKLFISANNIIINHVQMMNMSGQLIPVHYHKQQHSIVLKKLPSGIYFIKLETNKGTAYKQLIIE